MPVARQERRLVLLLAAPVALGMRAPQSLDSASTASSYEDPFCEQYKEQKDFYCSSDWAFKGDRNEGLIRDVCKVLWGAGSPARGDAHHEDTLNNVGMSGIAPEYVQLLTWAAPTISTCSPAACKTGGYSQQQPPQFSWNICTGCWSETCMRNVNFEDAVKLFQTEDKASAFSAGVKLLEKVYPIGARMWEFQKQMAEVKVAQTGTVDVLENPLLHGVMGFLEFEDKKKWTSCVNTPVHENTHVHHSSTGLFRPSNDFAYAIYPPWKRPCNGQFCQYEMENDRSINIQFPRRAEINDRFPEDIQNGIGGPNYFKAKTCDPDHEGGELGCQRLDGLMTETEAYLHGQIASSVFSTGVGAGNAWKPDIIPPDNDANNGATFPVAFWSLANVYYLQLVQKEYPHTWANLLNQGSEDWTDISELFLAHIDRATWFLRLSLDINDMTDDWHKQGYPPSFPPYKAISNKCRKLQLEALNENDVLTPLREALNLKPAGCQRQTL